MGKASVTLRFDNADGKIALDFDEVAVSRKIFRDGMNEYFLNDSHVRLKDIVELIARLGLGETKHNIIGQGEVDRMLLSSPLERRDMLEEALGLRVYQLKKNETERKLNATEENLRQAELLLREIKPHLTFLRSQAKKADMRGAVEAELRMFERIYFVREEEDIRKEKEDIGRRLEPLVKKHAAVARELEGILRDTGRTESGEEVRVASRANEEKLAVREARRREIEREIGRLEGKLEIAREGSAARITRTCDPAYIKEEIEQFIVEIRSILDEEDRIDVVRSHLFVLIEDLEKLIAQIEGGVAEDSGLRDTNPVVAELEKAIAGLEKEAGAIVAEIQKLEGALREERERFRAAREKMLESDRALAVRQEEERDLALQLERFKFDEERLRVREEGFLKELEEAGVGRSALQGMTAEGYGGETSEALRKKIERLRGKLEEIGGIDTAVMKEYQDTESRFSFLSKETEDLAAARATLRELIKELDRHITHDFDEGFSKIKKEFNAYFALIFGGGKAALTLVEKKRRSSSGDELEGEEMEETEEGIDIAVDLPRKRIKGLAMLSGGEKTLTSIALLLAIATVNPPPFLMLDETDAALDEANSQRYATILKELSQKTQLILVTHNRETMKCAGVLYGVTMGDDGITKLLSLKFEEAEAFTNR